MHAGNPYAPSKDVLFLETTSTTFDSELLSISRIVAEEFSEDDDYFNYIRFSNYG